MKHDTRRLDTRDNRRNTTTTITRHNKQGSERTNKRLDMCYRTCLNPFTVRLYTLPRYSNDKLETRDSRAVSWELWVESCELRAVSSEHWPMSTDLWAVSWKQCGVSWVLWVESWEQCAVTCEPSAISHETGCREHGTRGGKQEQWYVRVRRCGMRDTKQKVRDKRPLHKRTNRETGIQETRQVPRNKTRSIYDATCVTAHVASFAVYCLLATDAIQRRSQLTACDPSITRYCLLFNDAIQRRSQLTACDPSITRYWMLATDAIQRRSQLTAIYANILSKYLKHTNACWIL